MNLAHRTLKWHQGGPVGAMRPDQVAQRKTWTPAPEAAREPGFVDHPSSVIHVVPPNLGYSHGMGWHTQTEAAIDAEGGSHYLAGSDAPVIPAWRN